MRVSRYQSGAALFVSLIILLILSIIGISAVRGGLLQSLMAANAQQAEMTFSVADAGTGATLNAIRMQETDPNGLVNTAMQGMNPQIFVDSTGTISVDAVNFDADLPNPSMTVTTLTSYINSCDKTLCPGMDISVDSSVGCHLLSIDSNSTVVDTNANVTLWVSVLGAPGSC